jgi:hypothetical protein
MVFMTFMFRMNYNSVLILICMRVDWLAAVMSHLLKAKGGRIPPLTVGCLGRR